MSELEMALLAALEAEHESSVRELVCRLEDSSEPATENQVRNLLGHLRDKGDVVLGKQSKYYLTVHGKQRLLNHLMLTNPKSPLVEAARKQKSFVLPVRVEALDEGGYLAICESIQGCHAEGETIAEALDNIEDVAHVLLELRKKYDLPLPADLEELRPGRVFKAELLVQFPE